MATSFNVWFHIDDPVTVVSINKMEGEEKEGKIFSDAIRQFDNDLYNFVFPTDQPDYREDPIMVPVLSGGEPVLSGGEPVMEDSGETNNYVWVPEDGYVEMKGSDDLDDLDLQRAKDKQRQVIKTSFDALPDDGLTVTLSIGDTKVDAHRSNQDDFRQGKEWAERNGFTDTDIRDFNNVVHNVPITDLLLIVQAIQDMGIAGYEKKWYKQSLIDFCTTIGEVEEITWDSVEG